MEREQFILIILVIFIVGIAIVVGINMSRDQAASSNLDKVTSNLINLASRAQLHYRRPTAMGGGGGSFALLTANAAGLAYLTTQPKNKNGTYSIYTAGDATSVIIQGKGNEDGDGDGTPCTVQVQVLADSLIVTVINR